MMVNGLKLPERFVELISTPELPDWFSLQPKEKVDAYGNHWDARLDLWRGQESIEAETAYVAEVLKEHKEIDAEMEADPEEPPTEAGEPGFIPYFYDGSQVVCFGGGGEREPYCFDYRDNLEEPSVIYWDDVYWRRVAPDFASFIRLFHAPNPFSTEKPEEQERWAQYERLQAALDQITS